MHDIYIGIGSNLGDRQANILAALQRLRARAEIVRVSAFYESEPAAGADGPAFLNVAAALRSEFDRAGFEDFARDVEIAVGRSNTRKLAARPIDIDLLVFDDRVVQEHLAERLYNALPLSEIAPDFIERVVPGFTNNHFKNGVSPHIRKRERSLHFDANRQEEEPEVRLSLNRVGVSSVKRIVHLEVDGKSRVFNGEFSMVADLAPDKAGVHMSRFSEILEEATLDVLARDSKPMPIEQLAETIAREIVQSQSAVRADVRLRADFGLERWTPVSGKRGEETYTLVGIAVADASGHAKHVIGVEAEGMTACPCAQLMVREHSLHELMDAGFSKVDAERALDALPVATHNQRGRGSILIGTTTTQNTIRAEDLVEIVENSMSSETYDLLKRPDEFFIVNKAHHNPKFVEDVVRGILARALDMYADLADDTFIFASQINYESIHKHDAFAEANATFGELRLELRTGHYLTAKTDLGTWLRSN